MGMNTSIQTHSRRVIVTCGPGYEPIDEVRRITNFSTGELGTVLSERLARAGYETICLRGVAATHPAPSEVVSVRPFTTNRDLAAQLRALAADRPVAAVFHAAALSDYRVTQIRDASGRDVRGAKLASRGGSLLLRLDPSLKVIAQLRGWFPTSTIVGWKYELDGTAVDAIGKARRQVSENQADACIVNGRAFGDGFGFVDSTGCVARFGNKRRLSNLLTRWIQISKACRDEVFEPFRLLPELSWAA